MGPRKQQALQDQTATVERRVFLGIGDAVLRLIHVERMYADGVDPGNELAAERALIVQALNQQYQLDLGMDCDMDGIPDAIDSDVSVITHAAQTSCCRILPEGGNGSRKSPPSRVEPLPDPVSGRTPSRRATAEKKRQVKQDQGVKQDQVKQDQGVKKPPASRKKTTTPASRKKTTTPASRKTSRKAAPPAAKTVPKTPVEKPVTKKGGFLSAIFGNEEEK